MPNFLSPDDQSAFERLVADISTRFVSVTPANVSVFLSEGPRRPTLLVVTPR